MVDAENLPGSQGEPGEGGQGDDDLWPGPTLDEPGEPTGPAEPGKEGEGFKKWPGPTVDGGE